jgi:transaldolase
VATFEAFRDHGVVAATLEQGVDEALRVMAAVDAAGISMTAVTDRLQADAVALFVEPFDNLLGAIESQCAALPQG